jgi:hypothetical protein
MTSYSNRYSKSPPAAAKRLLILSRCRLDRIRSIAAWYSQNWKAFSRVGCRLLRAKLPSGQCRPLPAGDEFSVDWPVYLVSCHPLSSATKSEESVEAISADFLSMGLTASPITNRLRLKIHDNSESYPNGSFLALHKLHHRLVTNPAPRAVENPSDNGRK